MSGQFTKQERARLEFALDILVRRRDALDAAIRCLKTLGQPHHTEDALAAVKLIIDKHVATENATIRERLGMDDVGYIAPPIGYTAPKAFALGDLIPAAPPARCDELCRERAHPLTPEPKE